ncbi:MAG: galactose oxidase [Bacteroidetes bacterium]|nr:galactose oxidase [Bacteroidota bacterium]MBS1974101.1 galactose oxidase [Bacteroidota bacterium]
MYRTAIGALLFFFFLTADLSAQKNYVKSIEWDKAGLLPLTNGKALGLAGPVAGMHNEVLIVGGGSNFPDRLPWLGGKKKYYDDLYVFKKDDKGSLMLFKSFKLPFSLAYSANVSTSMGIVIAGGENESGISNKVLLARWDEGAQNISISNLPDLLFAVTNASAVAHDNKIYLAGGEMPGGVSSHFMYLDLNDVAAGWKNLPPLRQAVSHAVMAVQSNGHDDCIYLIGGRMKMADRPSDLYSSNFQFNLKTNEWKEKHSLPYALSAGTGSAVGANAILLFGGDKGETFHKTEELIFAINNEKDEERKKQLIAEKIKVQSAHPGFCKTVLLYNTKKDQWKTVGCIPFDSPVTTTAVNWDNEIFIPGGEIKAGVRTPQILLAKVF